MELRSQALREASVQPSPPSAQYLRGQPPLTVRLAGGDGGATKEEIFCPWAKPAKGLMGQWDDGAAASWGISTQLVKLGAVGSVPSHSGGGRHVLRACRMPYGHIDQEVRELREPKGPDVEDSLARSRELLNVNLPPSMAPTSSSMSAQVSHSESWR